MQKFEPTHDQLGAKIAGRGGARYSFRVEKGEIGAVGPIPAPAGPVPRSGVETRDLRRRRYGASANERTWGMQQQISVITIGIADLPRSRRFYVDGFGWTPVFENEQIIFYQMNGLMLGTFEKSALEADMN